MTSKRDDMTGDWFVPLSSRGLISLTGDRTVDFLQGLVTNDVAPVAQGKPVYAALLTPQGKYLHDFFVFARGDVVFIDCSSGRLDDLRRRLTRYRLRAPIEIADSSGDLDAFAVFGEGTQMRLGLNADATRSTAFAGGIAFIDPRSVNLGARVYLPAGHGEAALREAGFVAADEAVYDTHRISLGIADGDVEMEPEKSYPMDYGLDALHGISFTKGCYVGQEVTARMKSRALVRRRLIPVEIDGRAPAIGTPITAGSDNAGEVRAISGSLALALVRTEMVDKIQGSAEPLLAGGARLYPRPMA